MLGLINAPTQALLLGRPLIGQRRADGTAANPNGGAGGLLHGNGGNGFSKPMLPTVVFGGLAGLIGNGGTEGEAAHEKRRLHKPWTRSR